MIVLLDTSFLYGLANKRDQRHREALAMSHQLITYDFRVHTPSPTLLELHGLLLYRKSLDIDNALVKIQHFLDIFPLIHPDPIDVRDSLTLLRSLKQVKLTINDAIISSMATRLGAKVASFDQDFVLMGNDVYRWN